MLPGEARRFQFGPDIAHQCAVVVQVEQSTRSVQNFISWCRRHQKWRKNTFGESKSPKNCACGEPVVIYRYIICMDKHSRISTSWWENLHVPFLSKIRWQNLDRSTHETSSKRYSDDKKLFIIPKMNIFRLRRARPQYCKENVIFVMLCAPKARKNSQKKRKIDFRIYSNYY